MASSSQDNVHSGQGLPYQPATDRDGRPPSPPTNETRVAVVIATLPSRESFLERALRSVASQELLPCEVVVVVDHPPPKQLVDLAVEDPALVAKLHASKIENEIVPRVFFERPVEVKVLVNQRSKNMSGTGCWNTGIMQVLRRAVFDGGSYVLQEGTAAFNTFVAVLDDDDEWKPDHLRSCVEAINPAGVPRSPEQVRVEWVVPGIERWEADQRSIDNPTIEMPTPETVWERAFVRGNPGVQGSNLFVRLPLLLRAGCFDENLESMTDRDLCLRLLDVIGPTQDPIAFTRLATVKHHAEPGHERVTTNTDAKRAGILKFLWKHAPRFTKQDLDFFLDRCNKKFGILNVLEQMRSGPESPVALRATTTSGDEVGLQPLAAAYLSTHAAELSLSPSASIPAVAEAPVCGMFGVISSDLARLQPLLRDLSKLPLHITPHVVIFFNTTPTPPCDAVEDIVNGSRVSYTIVKRTDAAVSAIVDKYCGLANIKKTLSSPLPIGLARTVLQAHMRALLDTKQHHACEFAMVLDDDKRLPGSSFLSRDYLFELDRDVIYVGRDCNVAPNTLAFGLRVQLLDLCHSLRVNAMRVNASPGAAIPLEPLNTTCARNPADIYYDLSTSRYDHLEEPQLVDLSSGLPSLPSRLLRGDPFGRPCLPPVKPEPTTQRGGCMLVFRKQFEVLACPQFVPEVELGADPVLSRRSDAIWVAVHAARDVRCDALPGLFVYHDNASDAIPTPEQVRRNAVAETCGAVLCRGDGSDEEIATARREYLETRICSIIANNARTRATVQQIRTVEPALSDLLNELDKCLDETAWANEVIQPLVQQKSLLMTWSPWGLLDSWPDASVQVVAERLATRCHDTTRQAPDNASFVGQGEEGVVFRFGSSCYKVFHKRVNPDDSLRLSAKDVLNCSVVQQHPQCVLRYDYVPGDSYRGDHGAALVELLRSVRQRGLVMKNVKPANLVVTAGGRVEIVDLGRDWVPFEDSLWRSMCRRAFLSWLLGRWCNTTEGVKKLSLLLTQERRSEFFPELSGFEGFFHVCEHGQSPLFDSTRFERALPSPSVGLRAECTLLIKACLMEAATLRAHIRHIVWTLHRAGNVFQDTVLVVDRTRREGILRQHAPPDEPLFDTALEQVMSERLVDRVVDFDGSAAQNEERVRSLNLAFLGVDSVATHSLNDVAHGATFAGLDAVTTDLVLQVDADIILNMPEPEDVTARAAALFQADPLAVATTALPIYQNLNPDNKDPWPLQSIDGYVGSDGQPFRFEVRCCFIHMPRLRNVLPLKIPPHERAQDDRSAVLKRGWYRVLDSHLASRGLRNYRQFSKPGFFLHPPNELKKDIVDYLLLVDRLSSPDILSMMDRVAASPSRLPAQDAWRDQDGLVDVISADVGRFFGERAEDMVFVCCGRNVGHSRALECLRSLWLQRGVTGDRITVGLVVFDDASDENPSPLFDAARRLFPGRVSCIHAYQHLGTLQAKNHIIKRVCVNPASVIVTLDLDDRLLCQESSQLSVVERIREVFWNPDGSPRTDSLVALGGMVRHSKSKTYALGALDHVRTAPGAANVWQHLRCFRKFLFDAISVDHFFGKIGEEQQWIQHGTDWGFMIPIVEQAGADRVFEFPDDAKLYFYEECTKHTNEEKHHKLAQTQDFLHSLKPFERIQDVRWLLRSGPQPRLEAVCKMPNHSIPGRTVEQLTFSRNAVDHTQCVVLVVGRDKLRGGKDVPVRIHSECFTGDVWRSKRCDCGEQRLFFMEQVMARRECAALIYVQGQEGRGNGMTVKLKAYEMQDDQPETNHNDLVVKAGGVIDKRTYRDCVSILCHLGIDSVELFTNNPTKEAAVRHVLGTDNVRVARMTATLCAENARYLREKVNTNGHNAALVLEQEAASARANALPSAAADSTTPTFELLSRLVGSMLEGQPFHNLGVLSGAANPDGAAASQEQPERSGMCFDRNVFLSRELIRLGFSVRVIGARTRFFTEKPTNRVLRARGVCLPLDHICLIVGVPHPEGQRSTDFLVDVGNGAPYFTPLRVPCSPLQQVGDDGVADQANHCGVEYRVRSVASDSELLCDSSLITRDTCVVLVVEHRRLDRKDWRENYRFCSSHSLTQTDVHRIMSRHATDPFFGPMLSSLRINRWCRVGVSPVLRDLEVREVQPDGRVGQLERQLGSGRELEEWVRTHFEAMLPELDRAVPVLLEDLQAMDVKPDLQRVLSEYQSIRRE